MELSVREWMIIIGVLLIVAVLLDGYRRVRNENRHRIKVSLSRQAYRQARTSSPVVGVGDDDVPNPELPNGGARVISKRKVSLQLDQPVPVLLESVAIPPQPESEPEQEPELFAAGDAVAADDGFNEESREVERGVQSAVGVRAAVDPRGRDDREAEAGDARSDSDDQIDEYDHHRNHERSDIEDVEADDRRYDESAELPLEVAAMESTAPAVELAAASVRPEDESRTSAVTDRAAAANGDGRSSLHEHRVGLSGEDPDEDEGDDLASEASGARRSAWHAFGFRRRGEADEPSPARAGQSGTVAQEVIAIYVIARNGARFKGQDLLQLLLACDLRFGKMNIFHRHEKPNGRGAVQFSVANIAEPGTFDLDRIEDFSTPGVCLFLVLPGPEAPYKAFDYMVETAQVLVKHLDGELRDDAHSALTRQTLEHCRQRIRDFERKQLTLHL